MPSDCITYQNSGYFTPIVTDYLNQHTNLQPFYHRFPTLENFGKQIEEKKKNYTNSGHRSPLVAALEKQNSKITLSESSQKNLVFLKDENTFTITTGHQLTLFTGPLYFLYKIVSTINLCKTLQKNYPNYHFVPVYWMATEDHDFEEINHFVAHGKKITWNQNQKGPVGRLPTKGLEKTWEELSEILGPGDNAHYLKALFEKAYVIHDNLADATRFLVNELFKEEGLLIVDGDDSSLKRAFIPYVEKELKDQHAFAQVTQTITGLSAYDIQVNPREINLFYIEDGLRERIIFDNNRYLINNTSLAFSKEEILALLQSNPEKFSPNVILRPLYQEVILPNLCYIGGGGELAYWFELKQLFASFDVPFPILLLRNSVVLVPEKWNQKRQKLDLQWGELFLKSEELIQQKTKAYSKFTIDFSPQKETLRNQFDTLYQIASETDKSFVGAVKAQEAKQIKGLENLEKRLLKAEKRVLAERLDKIKEVQDALFPKGSLQERKENFSTFFLNTENLIPMLLERLDPLEQEFSILIVK